MDHEHAVRELATERYLLGELTGDARLAFEAHLFECSLCAADLKSSVRLANAMRTELASQPATRAASSAQAAFSRWFKPTWLVPALAACLLLILFQNAFQVPRLNTQLAQANEPEVLSSLVLAGGTTRGIEMPHVEAVRGKSFLLSIDIPPGTVADSYRCTLLTPSGRQAWSVAITAEQARNTVLLRVPASATEPGEQTLVIRTDKAEVVTTMRFVLQLHS